MFDGLLWGVVIVALIGLLAAYDGSRDVFHPLIFIAPMLIFLYGWMPMELAGSGSLAPFFNTEQLVFVQTVNLCGVAAFVTGCLVVGVRLPKKVQREPIRLSPAGCLRLRIGAAVTGSMGLACWVVTIVNVGGFVNAFSRSYSGGWDDSGYVRDGNLLLLVGVLLAVAAIAAEGFRVVNVAIVALFALPWLAQALLTARRGPTFAFAVVAGMGYFLLKGRRPPLLATAAAGLCLGWLTLFLVTNRSNIYLGSDAAFETSSEDVTSIVEKSDTGNEYIYGSGTILSAIQRDHYFWMRRYLAQLLVRPIPSSIWPTKYEDFGVPELLSNAGTGEGFADALGWKGAEGSAPGIVADLWIELWWLAVPAMAGLGWLYGFLWRKATSGDAAWQCQYVIFSALSIYLVMQTMEAVIFRSLLLSVPCWLVWKWARHTSPTEAREERLRTRMARNLEEAGVYGA